MSLDDATPGWYGKLPTLGDFASRRLEADFIEPWDVWLGECMQAQRDAMGEAWLDAYLHSPPWRFLLMPGVLDGKEPQQMLGGVLMPSVDRVGRYFPLTIVAARSRSRRARPSSTRCCWPGCTGSKTSPSMPCRKTGASTSSRTRWHPRSRRPPSTTFKTTRWLACAQR